MAKTFQLAEAERRIEQLEEQLDTARNELQFMASTEKGKLRAVNAKLLSALEASERLLTKLAIAGLLDGFNGAFTLTETRAAIEEAKK